jgi:two-component system, OmpR family, sensor histidine kinase KdpD
VVTPSFHAAAAERHDAPQVLESRGAVPWARYAWALATTVGCSAVCFAMYAHLELVNLAMVYLLGVVIAGLRFGRGPSVLTSVANVLVFDFCFVPPRFSLAVSDVQYLFTFAVMLTVALVIATLVASVRQQTRVAGARERRTAMLYAMSRELAASRGVGAMAEVAVRHVADVFQCRATLLLPDTAGQLSHPRGAPLQQSFRGADLAVAQWVTDHGQRAGIGTDTLPAAPGLYMPLGDAQRRLGVLAVLANSPRRVLLPEQRHLLETFAGQIGLGIERARLAERAETARVTAEGESVRNTLLASISHDLRTPLAVISGASSTLSERGEALEPGARRRLARSIETKAREMAELISNVLDLTRFEAGRIELRRDWETLDDLVGSALETMEGRLDGHEVKVALAPDLPAVYVDARLVVQLLANLLDNAAKYTPAGTLIHITALVDGPHLRVQLDDEGPGLPAGDPERLFNKFQRGNEEGAVVGAGLGLAICRTIARAHGTDIEAMRRPGGGTRFEFTLPLAAEPAAERSP